MAKQLTHARKFAFLVDHNINSSRQQIRPHDDHVESVLSKSNQRPTSSIQNGVRISTKNNWETIPLNDITTLSTRQVSFNTQPRISPQEGKASHKKVIVGSLVGMVIIIIVILAIVLPIVLTRNPSVTNPTTTSTMSTIPIEAYWSFDNDANDKYGTYNGIVVNGALFTNPTYFGYGANLLFNASLNQSVVIVSPFLNLSYTSFTLEAWIFSPSLAGDNGIFSQCQCASCQDQCLHLIIRNARMYMGFTLDDLVGINTVPTNSWTHIAYVYDYSTRTQLIYMQGVVDNSKASAGPYQGQSGSVVIGSSHLSSSSFNGFIDNVRMTTRAKSAQEILDAASIVTYFSFDGSALGQDIGPNQINGTISNAAPVSGRAGQGLAFSGAPTSYLQVYGYFQLGRTNQPYTFALWIYPYSTTGGLIIQKNDSPNSIAGWCTALMGITNSGQIGIFGNASPRPIVIGPLLSPRAWTHVGYTYSLSNGIRLYVNGIFFGTSGPVSFSSSNMIDYLNIGSYVPSYCGTGSISSTSFQGIIDEFYVFRRELNSNEIVALTNP